MNLSTSKKYPHPKTCEYRLHGKKESMEQMELGANQQTLRYILDYLGGPSVITRVPKSGRTGRRKSVSE